MLLFNITHVFELAPRVLLVRPGLQIRGEIAHEKEHVAAVEVGVRVGSQFSVTLQRCMYITLKTD